MRQYAYLVVDLKRTQTFRKLLSKVDTGMSFRQPVVSLAVYSYLRCIGDLLDEIEYHMLGFLAKDPMSRDTKDRVHVGTRPPIDADM